MDNIQYLDFRPNEYLICYFSFVCDLRYGWVCGVPSNAVNFNNETGLANYYEMDFLRMFLIWPHRPS